MFDPDKVGRWLSQEGSIVTEGGTWVKASDYDQLLQLYRALQLHTDSDPSLPQSLWSPGRCAYVASRQKAQIEHPGSVEGMAGKQCNSERPDWWIQDESGHWPNESAWSGHRGVPKLP